MPGFRPLATAYTFRLGMAVPPLLLLLGQLPLWGLFGIDPVEK
jgi:hypothetical protein